MKRRTCIVILVFCSFRTQNLIIVYYCVFPTFAAMQKVSKILNRPVMSSALIYTARLSAGTFALCSWRFRRTWQPRPNGRDGLNCKRHIWLTVAPRSGRRPALHIANTCGMWVYVRDIVLRCDEYVVRSQVHMVVWLSTNIHVSWKWETHIRLC